jgi:hypothetical protein
MRTSLAILLLFSAGCGMRTDARPASPSPIEEFANRAKAYAKLQKKLRSKLPTLKDKAEPERIVEHEKLLQAALRQARKTAKQGDIFIPAVRPYLAQLIKAELSGPTNKPAREAVKESNPRGGEEPSPKPVPLAVNAVYPKDAPLTTVPPSLLLKLPKLPEELEFRFVGKALILRDTVANLIVDYLPEVAP